MSRAVNALEHAEASDAEDEAQLAFDALLYRLVVIGEAVKALPADLLARQPLVPWREVARLRDLLAHHYYRVDAQIIRRTVEAPAQHVQPLLRNAQAGMISRMPGGLHPPVTAHHRRRDRHRLAEHHQVPVSDLARPGRDQRRPPVFPQPPPGRGGQVRHPDRDYARPAQQLSGGIPAIGGDIRRHDRVERHQEAPGTMRLARRLLFYREPPVGTGIHRGVSRTSPPASPSRPCRS